MSSNIVLSNEKNNLHDVKLHNFHTTPHAILKNRMYLQKYLDPNIRMLNNWSDSDIRT